MNITCETMETLWSEHGMSQEFLSIASSFRTRTSNIEDALCLPFKLVDSEEYLGT